jgi:hypothetical protein
MSKTEQAIQSFVAVRNELLEQTDVYRAAYCKPLKFYFEHSKEEAIDILMREAGLLSVV